MFTALITLLTALSISVIAAYVSVTGMMAIFPAAASVVMFLMASLEVGKLVGASWLKLNWKNSAVNPLHKTLLTTIVVVLMGITSLGMYGFLSKGYLEQSTPVAGTELQIKQKEQSLKMIEMDNDRLQKKLDQLDANISAFLKGDKAERANTVLTRQKQERVGIEKELKDNNDKIKKLNEEILPLKMATTEVEAKLGPIKYVAALFGWQDVGTAVRMVIMMMIFVSDPLAVLLLLSAQISFIDWMKSRRSYQEGQHREPHSSSEESEIIPEPSSEPDATNHNDVIPSIQNMPDEEVIKAIEQPYVASPLDTSELPGIYFERPDTPLEQAVIVNDGPALPASLDLNTEVPETPRKKHRGKKVAIEPGVTKTKTSRKRVEESIPVPTPAEIEEAYQSSLKRLATAYKGGEQTVTPSQDDKQRFIEILENKPELLSTLIDVIREDDRTDVKVDLPASEFPAGEGNNVNAVTSNVSQEQLARNLNRGWLRKPQ